MNPMTALIQQAEYLRQFTWEVTNESRWGRSETENRDVRNLVNRLAQAEPFYVAPAVCELIDHASASVPVWPLRQHDLLCHHGFVWFAKPSVVSLGEGSAELRALQLSAIVLVDELPQESEGFADSPLPVNGLKISALFDIRTPIVDDGGHTHGSGLIKHFDTWEFGAAQPDGDFHDKAIVGMKSHLRWWVWCHVFSLLAFMNQRVIARQRQDPDRATRRLAERQRLPPRSINVITLRRSHVHHGEPSGDPVPWSCRWWVGGHWRQQACGEDRAERRPVWIAPYLKGPEDKPIVLKGRLFAVVR